MTDPRWHLSIEMDATEQRDVLAETLCKHSMTSDWFEKADEVLASLADQGLILQPADRQAWAERIVTAACDQEGNWWRRVEVAVASGDRAWIEEANSDG